MFVVHRILFADQIWWWLSDEQNRDFLEYFTFSEGFGMIEMICKISVKKNRILNTKFCTTLQKTTMNTTFVFGFAILSWNFPCWHTSKIRHGFTGGDPKHQQNQVSMQTNLVNRNKIKLFRMLLIPWQGNYLVTLALLGKKQIIMTARSDGIFLLPWWQQLMV